MELIKVKGFMLEQVFDMNSMGLFWKRMPSHTFLSKKERYAPGLKVARIGMPFFNAAMQKVTL